MGRKRLKKKGDIKGFIDSLFAEARSLFATIQLRQPNNGKRIRSARRLSIVAGELAEAFEELGRKKEQPSV